MFVFLFFLFVVCCLFCFFVVFVVDVVFLWSCFVLLLVSFCCCFCFFNYKLPFIIHYIQCVSGSADGRSRNILLYCLVVTQAYYGDSGFEK